MTLHIYVFCLFIIESFHSFHWIFSFIFIGNCNSLTLIHIEKLSTSILAYMAKGMIWDWVMVFIAYIDKSTFCTLKHGSGPQMSRYLALLRVRTLCPTALNSLMMLQTMAFFVVLHSSDMFSPNSVCGSTHQPQSGSRGLTEVTPTIKNCCKSHTSQHHYCQPHQLADTRFNKKL